MQEIGEPEMMMVEGGGFVDWICDTAIWLATLLNDILPTGLGDPYPEADGMQVK